MATFSITTSADQDAAAKYACDEYNAAAKDTLTPVQYAKQRIDQWLNGLVERWQTETRTTKAEAYQKATPSDQAAVDAILAKYQ
jgi:hypothetical protein